MNSLYKKILKLKIIQAREFFYANKGNIFFPAIALMNKLKYLQKFFVIFIITLVLTSVIMLLLLLNIFERISFNNKKIIGVEYISAINPFLKDLQKFRYYNYLQSINEEDPKYRVNLIKTSASSNISNIDKIDQKFNKILKIENKWSNIKNKWNFIILNWKSLKYKELEHEQEKIIQAKIDLINHINHSSNLILDSDLSTFYLIVAFSLKLPSLMENIELLKIEVNKALHEKKYNKTELIKLSILIEKLNDLIKSGIDTIYRTNCPLKTSLDKKFNLTYATNKKLLNSLDLIIKGKETNPNNFVKLAESSCKNVEQLNKIYSANLNTLIKKRVKKYIYPIPVIILFTFISLIVLLYIFVGFYFSVTNTISNLLTNLEKVSKGNLNIEIPICSEDELGEAIEHINKILKRN